MSSFRVLLLLFSFCIYLSLLSTQARFHHHHHKKHKHNNHPVSQISRPPSSSPFPSPEPSDPDQQPPSSSAPSPSPAPDDPDHQSPPSPTPSDPYQEPPSSSASHSPPPSDPYQKPPSSSASHSPPPSVPPQQPPSSSASHSPPPSDPHQQTPPSSASPSPAPSDPYQQPPSSDIPSPPPSDPYQKPPPPPSDTDDNYYNSSTIFDVRKFGAVGNGMTDDTDAFKSAWDAACEVETGVLLVPSHHTFMIQSTFFTGPCQPGFVFQVEGTIWPPDGPESWPEKNSKRQWLVFYRINNMSLQGTGLIDGRGEQWWNLPCKPHRGPHGTTLPGPCDSPIAIRFYMSNNLTVKGLKIKDSPQFHFRFDSCRNVRIDSINITAPPLSPNTDGIHIENSNNVQIYNSIISNGDDCVSIGSGCYDVDVKNITCEHGHGISIGSLGNHNSRACVSNITVRESSLKQSDNGVRIKTWQGGSGAVSSVTFENIHMDNVRNPIIIDQFYCLSRECSNLTSAVLISDIEYTNIKGTYNVRNPPMHLACSDSVPCTNITFSDVELLPAQGDLVLDPYCWNAYGELATVTIPPVSCLLEGNPKTILESSLGYC